MGRKWFFILLAAILQGVIALEIEKLLIPRHALRNTSVKLECSYNLGGETLYSVKWYKDGHEFYRFVPRNQIPYQVFDIPGVTVDRHNSTDFSVVLLSVQLSTSGRYKCEVSGEAPSFNTVRETAQMTIVALPQSGPEISGGKMKYQVGDVVNVSCTIRESSPVATLSWMINGRRANPDYIIGPFNQLVDREGLETTTLGLQFIANHSHFINGSMKLKCLATIAPVYTNDNEKSYEAERIHIQVMHSKDTYKTGLRPSPSYDGTVPPPVSRADRVRISGSATIPVSIITTTTSKILLIVWIYLNSFI